MLRTPKNDLSIVAIQGAYLCKMLAFAARRVPPSDGWTIGALVGRSAAPEIEGDGMMQLNWRESKNIDLAIDQLRALTLANHLAFAARRVPPSNLRS